MRDRDHVGRQSGHRLGTGDLAARRARIAEVDEIETVAAGRHRPPGQRGGARHPPFEQRVAVGDPAAARAGRARSTPPIGAQGQDLGSHALGEVHHGGPVVGAADGPGSPCPAPSTPAARRPARRRATGERRPRPGAAVAEVVGGGGVVELERRWRRRRARAGPRPGSGRTARCRRGCARGVTGIEARVGHTGRGPPRAAPQERLHLGRPARLEAGWPRGRPARRHLPLAASRSRGSVTGCRAPGRGTSPPRRRRPTAPAR